MFASYTTSTINLELQAETLLQTLTQSQNDPLAILSSIITIHGLKVAARGRAVRDKNGNITLKTNKKTGEQYTFTSANSTALKLLQNGTNDDSGILDDLTQQTALNIWVAITEGKAIITHNEEKKPP